MSNKIQFISKSLSSYKLVKWTRTAVTWSSFCMYSAWLVTAGVGVGVAVLYCSGAVKTPNTFTNEEDANIKFAYGLHNAHCRAAVVQFHHRHPHCETLETIHRILRESGSFPWVNAECEEPRHGEIDVLVAVQWSRSASIQRIFQMTGTAQTRVWRIMHCDDFYLSHLQRV